MNSCIIPLCQLMNDHLQKQQINHGYYVNYYILKHEATLGWHYPLVVYIQI